MKRLTVIVPIYNALDDVKLCLNSLLEKFNFSLGKIILVNDCSDTSTTSYLEEFCLKNKTFKLINNKENLGFVKTCNKGMKLAKTNYIVLLNSDTIIPKNFTEKIIKCLDSDPKIGLASPISSNSNAYYIPMRPGYNLEKMNKKIQNEHQATYPLISEAEGFCFCINKKVIDQQGYLDEIYGKGYHEEVDFSYRAITNGWKIVLIDDLYVYHKRQASFGEKQRAIQLEQNNSIFYERWNGFREKYKLENNIYNPCILLEKKLFKNSYKKPSSYRKKDYETYIKKMEIIQESNEYKDFCEYNTPVKSNVKPIAFYLPQFHCFEENEQWYGKGFTEWTNVTKSIPLYAGHYQPHLPIDVGFYNLNNNDVIYRQIELAKNYGIHGFAFYYYWFSGKKLMEKPIYNYLNDKNLNFPFCLCWACENWSKLWDGGNKELLIESKLNNGDAELFWNDILPFLKDSRYIRINNKPVIIMYRPNKFEKEKVKNFIETIRLKAKKEDFKELYLIWAITNDIPSETLEFNPQEWGFDACLEFPPHGIRNNKNKDKNIEIKSISGYLNPDFRGTIYDFKDFITNQKYEKPLFNTNIYRGIFPTWDNSSRKAKTGALIFHGTVPDYYKIWLKSILDWTKNNRAQDEQYIFINAWNEWAEGAHLEPDMRYGYAFLQATREVLDE